MSDFWIWAAVGAVTLATVVTRSGLLLLGDRVRLPQIVDDALGYAPACALAAILIPDLMLTDGRMGLPQENFRLLAALVATAAFLATRSLLITIAAGMIAFTAFRLLG